MSTLTFFFGNPQGAATETAADLAALLGDATVSAATAVAIEARLGTGLSSFGDDHASGMIVTSTTVAGGSGVGTRVARAELFKSAPGSYYAEFEITVGVTGRLGIANASAGLTTVLGGDANAWAYVGDDGTKITGGSAEAYGATFGNGDVIGMLLTIRRDGTASLEFFKNGASQGVAYDAIPAGAYAPALMPGIGWTFRYNFGAEAFDHEVSAGIWIDAITLEDATFSASASMGAEISADVAATLGDLAGEASATLAIAASIAGTTDAVQLSAAATLAGTTADLSALLADATATASATLAIAADIAATTDVLTVALDASISTPGETTANLSQVLVDMTFTATATAAIAGALTTTLDLTASADASLAIAGSIGVTLGAMDLSAQAGQEATTTDLAAVLSNASFSGSAAVAIAASIGVGLEDSSASASASSAVAASLSATLDAIGFEADAGTGSFDLLATLDGLALGLTAEVRISVDVAATLGLLTLTSSAGTGGLTGPGLVTPSSRARGGVSLSSRARGGLTLNDGPRPS